MLPVFTNLFRSIAAAKPKPLSVGLVISITSGSGYMGSTYTVNTNNPGQWYADGAPISGATSANYTMTSDQEGKAIYFVANSIESNRIRMFTPDQISSIIGWWDASATSTFTLVSNAVSQWNSRVGTINLFQTTAGSRPTWSATGRNGAPAVSTNLTSPGSLLNYSDTTGFPSGAANCHMFALAYNVENSTTWKSLSMVNGRFYGKGNTGTPAVTVPGGAAYDNKAEESWVEQDRIVSWAMTPTRTLINVDGEINGTQLNNTFSTTGTSTMFQSPTGSQFWRGSVQDWIMFGSDLPVYQRQQVEGYLAHKWGYTSRLPIEHPFKYVAPRATLVVYVSSGNGYAGSTFTASKSGGQWYVDDVAISGATGQSYVMTNANEGKTLTYKVGAEVSNAIKLFVPSDISGVVLWLDASDSSTIVMDGSNRVSQWSSKVGSIVLNQATVANQPIYNATGRNGKPTIGKNGATHMTFSSTTGLPLGGADSYASVVAYHDSTNHSGWLELCRWGQGSSGKARSHALANPAEMVSMTGVASSWEVVSSVSWLNADRIVSSYISGAGASLHVDGAISANASITTTFNTIDSPAYFFSWYATNTAGDSWPGSCQEYIVFDRKVSITERQRLEGYQAAKWGLQGLLPTNHPYKNSPPTKDLFIYVGIGSGYTGSTYYTTGTGGQWYVDEIATGNTSEAYVLTYADEGKSLTYRIGATISNAIKLFTPNQISGLAFWLDAYDESTMTKDGSGNLETWASKVGSVSVTQATLANRPVWKATGRNGMPTVDNAGGTRGMTFASLTGIPAGTSTSHVFATAYHDSTTSVWQPIWLQGTHTTTGGGRTIYKAGSNNNVLATTMGASNDTFGTLNWNNVDRIVSAAFADGNAVRLNVDGTSTVTNTASWNTTVSTAYLMMSPAEGRYWAGSMQEIMIYNRELSAIERQQVEGYKAAKWNLRGQLPNDHPYKINAPRV